MLKTHNSKLFRLSVLAMALAIIPLGSQAAGLGRVTVTSALGQPLRAEIEVTANRDEVSSLTARMASLDAFKNAGIEYTPSLSGLRFSLDKRPNGQVFLVASSDRPFNDPFVDMLVELNWASGRLVREYTFLLDPPDIVKKAEIPAPAVAVPEVKREAAVPAAPATPAAPAAAETAPASPAAAAPAPAVQPRAPAPAAPVPAAAATAPSKSAAAGTSRHVAKGDTLAKIATQVKPAGVNLDQMLAALFLSNKEAFDGGNMNRLRAGKILKIPENEAAAAVAPVEAHQMVVAQAADFNAYRKKLAGAVAAEPAKEEAPKQAASGKITPKVEEKAPPAAAGKDKLEVSRNESAKGAKAGRAGAAEEDQIAREKALKEANERIVALEKNLADMKKLAEAKGAAAAKPAEAPAKPAEPPKPVPAPVLAVPAKPVEPAEAPKAAEPPKPAEPPLPPPSFVEENPEIVFGGAAIVALLLGYLGYNAWRRKRAAAAEEADTGAAESSSVFGTSGGQTVDTGAAPPTDFSQQPDTSGDEGVDPVAEADVYIAYGRDTQAEEILLEALKTDPTRTAIHVKLLEIYAARKDISSFESVARELYGLTGGAGPEWERAQLLGRSIDPANPLYGGTETAAAAAPEPEPEALDMTSTVITSTAALTSAATPAPQTEAAPAPEAPAEDMAATLDFDLDLGAATPAEASAASASETPAAEETASLDFDLGSPAEPEASATAAAEAAASAGLDFELDMPAPEALAASEPAASPAADANAIDFDFDLSEPASPAAAESDAATELAMPALDIPLAGEPEQPKPAEEEPAIEPEMPALDLSGIDLDLDEPAAPAAPQLPPMPETTVIVDDPEVATKLELAQAYEEMGDKEGARELLNEVLNEGSPAQQDAAREKLAALG